MSDSRAEFETFISLPPHEKEILRFPDDGSSAWPGSYKNLIVDLAWDAWQASRQALEGEAIGEVGYMIQPNWDDPSKTKGVALVDKSLAPGTKLYTHPASRQALE